MAIIVERDTYAGPKGERGDCSIRAFSVAACVSYDSARQVFEKHGKHPNKGTPYAVSLDAIKDHFPASPVIRIDKKLTVNQFVKQHQEGHYIVHVTRHAFAVVDGIVHDWKARPRSKVLCAWRLV